MKRMSLFMVISLITCASVLCIHRPDIKKMQGKLNPQQLAELQKRQMELRKRGLGQRHHPNNLSKFKRKPVVPVQQANQNQNNEQQETKTEEKEPAKNQE